MSKVKMVVLHGANDIQEIDDAITQRNYCPEIAQNAKKIVSIMWDTEINLNRRKRWEMKPPDNLFVRMKKNHSMKLFPKFPYNEQLSVGFGTGFCIGKNLIVTAGHCIFDENNLIDVKTLRFVFNYKLIDGTQNPIDFPFEDVYVGKRIVWCSNNKERGDWAIIEIDGDIPSDRIVSFRQTDVIDNSQQLYVIGHPLGLPMKFAAGASVIDNILLNYFSANLDTFGGNSGSPVFNALTHEVEGILVNGEPDFVLDDDGFYKPRQCDDVGKDKCLGEYCQRISIISRPNQWIRFN